MSFPEPVPGLVIRYSYLWHDEHRRGQEEGLKDRPCAIVLTSASVVNQRSVVVLPVTHTPPQDEDAAVEIPHAVKRRLGLDDGRSWVMLSEANRFIWPGPDLRPAWRGEAESVVYGQLPYAFFEQIRQGFIAAIRARQVRAVQRSE
jgi:hypothetical protein